MFSLPTVDGGILTLFEKGSKNNNNKRLGGAIWPTLAESSSARAIFFLYNSAHLLYDK